MVSTGDTAISLHIRSAPIFILWGRGDGHTPDQLNPKCKDLSKAKFFLEGGGSGVTPDQLYPNCPDLSKSEFSGLGVGVGGGKGVCSRPTQPKVPRSVQSLIFFGGGEGVGLLQTNSTQTAQICPNLNFRGWRWGGWGGRECSPDQLKLKVPRST